ncbi:MAG TPA: VOC family protein [Fimbriimonas sp.]|nr:VOC family protein [Fimbriimonas sp.]
MNTLCHVEYEVTDLVKSQAFYQGLFGWDFRAFFDGMVIFGKGDEHIGGLMKVESVTAGKSPALYFKVESLDDCLAKAVALGGSAPNERHPVPGVGWSVTVLDPDGNLVGLVQYD